MWILRALVRITFLLQGPKLKPQGTAKEMEIENVWWAKKHQRFLCEFCAHLSGSHFCCKDPNWNLKGQPKEWKREMSDRFLCEFHARLSGSQYCCKDPNGDPMEQPKDWKWKLHDWQKNINDFCVNFARPCQEHTFAARIQIGTAKDSQRNENGKCLMGKKTKATFMWFLRAPVRITLLLQGPKLKLQGTAKGMNMDNFWWAKNINDFFMNFARACQDHTFPARIQAGTPRDNQRNENGKCLKGQKT